MHQKVDQQQLRILINKVLNGTATTEERLLVDAWYQNENNKDVVWETDDLHEEAAIEQRMRDGLVAHMSSERQPVGKVIRMKVFTRVAAALLVFACLGATFLHFYNQYKNTGNITASTAIKENRYVLLPDSSVVVMHPGSNINFDFTGSVRKLNLTGEAYFDIKHRTDKPFVIQTGAVTTTVLGTAFNIKAYQGKEVVVMVTRGKVSVSDAQRKVRAILTPDQQAEVSQNTQVVAKRQVADHAAINWLKADMQFDEMPFKVLAGSLQHRYNVTFNFANPAVEQCPITGRFNGTESLKEVLDIISQTTSASCVINGNTVTVDGKGCTP